MGPNDLTKLISRSFIVTLLVGAIMAVFFDRTYAIGFLFGGLWNSINLFALKVLVEEFFHQRRPVVVFGFILIKLPILYGGGALILMNVPLSILTALIGFHVPFGIIVFEAVRLALNDPSATRAEQANPTISVRNE